MSDVIRFPKLGRKSSANTSVLTVEEAGIADLKMSDLYEAQPRSTSVGSSNSEVSSDSVTELPQHTNSLLTTITGWSNQELADLYRTQRILTLAGIHTKVDHGITDEGDPWFVFMDNQNEVFVHFSRFDGFYIATSQMHEAVIKGGSLQDLVSEFSKRVTPAAGDGRSGKNVVSIAGRSRNAVLIHPAAALAALVWSVYLMSDDLVAAGPMTYPGELDSTARPHFTALPADAQGLLSDLDVLPKVVHKALQVLSDPVVAKHFIDPLANRDAIGMTITSVKALGLGLSLVAFSIGLPILDTTIASSDSDSKSNQFGIQNLYTLLTDAKEGGLLIETIAGNTPEHQSEIMDQVRNVTSADFIPEVSSNSYNFNGIIYVKSVLNTQKVNYQVGTQDLTEPKNELARHLISKGEAEFHPEGIKETTEATSVLQYSVDGPANVSAEKNGLMQSFYAAFESFNLTDIAPISQIEMDELLGSMDELLGSMDDLLTESDTVNTLESPLAAAEPVQYDVFDDQARLFLDFLLSTYTDIRIIDRPTDIIFIHMGDIEAGSSHGQMYSRSWSFGDTGTISVIGLKSDMIHFDLIA